MPDIVDEDIRRQFESAVANLITVCHRLPPDVQVSARNVITGKVWDASFIELEIERRRIE